MLTIILIAIIAWLLGVACGERAMLDVIWRVCTDTQKSVILKHFKEKGHVTFVKWAKNLD